jgi:hypothetical protein
MAMKRSKRIGGKKAALFKKSAQKLLLIAGTGNGVPMIATGGGDYRHSRFNRLQLIKVFARFF